MRGIQQDDEIDKQSSYSNDFVPQKLLSVIKNENNKELNELILSYISYKEEIDSKLNDNKPIKHISFKKAIYSSLEKLIYQIIHIKSPPLRKSQITSAYRWFKKQTSLYYSVSSIRSKTSIEIGQNFDDQIIKDIEREKASKERIKEDHAKHRDPLLAIGQFEQFKVKSIRLKGDKSAEKQAAMPKTSPVKYKNDDHLRSTCYSSCDFTKTMPITKTSMNISNSILNTTTKPNEAINPSKELKSSFSYTRPDFNYCMCDILKKVEKERNKQIASKRTKESFNLSLQDFGFRRAKFKEQMLKKYELKKLKSQYESSFNAEESQPSARNHFNKSATLIYQSREELKLKGKYLKFPRRLSSSDAKGERERGLEAKNVAENIGKVYMDNISNMSNDKRIAPSKKEVKYSLLVNEARAANKDNILYKQIEGDELPSSQSLSLAMQLHPSIKMRFIHKGLCDVKEIDKSKEQSAKAIPLSAYDLSQYRQERDDTEGNHKDGMIKSGSLYIKANFSRHKLDYLTLRKSIDNYKSKETMSLKNQLVLNRSAVNIKSLAKAFINPSIETNYPLHYLPKPSSGLLVVPISTF